MPRGPVGQASRWAATSNAKVGQTTYSVNRERVGTEGREGSQGQNRKEEDKKGGSEIEYGAYGSLSSEGEMYLDIRAGAPEFLVTPLSVDGASLPT